MKPIFYLLLTMLLSMAGMETMAHDFAVENAEGVMMYYVKTSDTEVAVSYKGEGYYHAEAVYAGEVIIPESVTYEGVTYSVTGINEYAFYSVDPDANMLTALTVPKTVTSVGSYAFLSCSNLASLTVHCKEIGASWFERTYITTLTLGDEVTTIGNSAFAYCFYLGTINFGKNLKSIGKNAFFYCRDALKSVVLPLGLETLGVYAFDYCESLKEVTIPKSVTSIGELAFYHSKNLTKVTVEIEEPLSITKNTFGVYVPATLYVPYGCGTAYGEAPIWQDFGTIVELPPVAQCATPTISYKGGKLTFDCETEDVDFVSTITSPASTAIHGQEIDLNVDFTVSVYAKKEGFRDSEVTTQQINVRGLKGDVNNDGLVTITDAVNVVDIILNEAE